MRVRYGIPSYIVLNDYQIKEVNDTEKGLIFKQILTQKNLKFRTRIQQASAKLRNVFVKALLWC